MFLVPRFWLALTCFIMLFISGCMFNEFKPSRTELDPPTSPNGILVIGHIDMSETSNTFERVDIERIKPAPETYTNRFWRYTVGDSYTFYSEVLTPGQYQFLGFGGWSGANGVWFDLHDNPKFMRTFSKPGIHFIGAYKVKKIMPQGMIGRVKYEIISVPGPSERELLMQILPSAKHVYWKNMIERRLRELPK